jgi:hypothetical protein
VIVVPPREVARIGFLEGNSDLGDATRLDNREREGS